MSSFSDFIKYSLTPTLFERIDSALTELEFTKSGNRWISKHHISGELSRKGSVDQTYISSKRPHLISDQRGETLSIIDYCIKYVLNGRTDNKEDMVEAVKYLSSKVELPLPPQTPEEAEKYRVYKEKLSNLEEFSETMKKDLFSPEGAEALKYLTEERKWSIEEIKEAELGYCSPSTYNRLKNTFNTQIGKGGVDYVLSIPYRVSGRLRGFSFRVIKPNIEPKIKEFLPEGLGGKGFIGLTGLSLSGDKFEDVNITVVEGELDYLRATINGVKNVVGATGSSIPSEALFEAKKRGVRFVTLLLDRDETELKQKETAEKTLKAIEVVKEVGLTPFVAEFPSEGLGVKVDADSFLSSHTGEELRNLIGNSKAWFDWFIDYKLSIANSVNTDKAYTLFIDTVAEEALKDSTTDRDRQNLLYAFKVKTNEELDLSPEVSKKKERENKKRQSEETKKTIEELQSLTSEGKFSEALSLMETKSRELQSISKEEKFRADSVTPSEGFLLEEFSNISQSIATEYTFFAHKKDSTPEAFPFVIPQGALTLIGAPTSHGKSRMTQNLSLQLATNGEEGTVLYFTFEEDRISTQLELFNIFQAREALTDNTIKPLTEVSSNNLRTLREFFQSKGANTSYFSGGESQTETKRQRLLTKLSQFESLLRENRLRVFSPDYTDSASIIEFIEFWRREHKVKAVFIDYVQKLKKASATKQQKTDMFEDIMTEFDKYSQVSGLPIVFAVQLNREALSPLEMDVQNIADSTSLERTANTVLLLWNSNEKKRSSSKATDKQLGELYERGLKELGTHEKEGTLYAVLRKNRGGVRNIDTIFNFNGNTGLISQGEKEGSKQFPSNNSSISKKYG